MLKKGGLSAVNIDNLTEETYVAKGTYNAMIDSMIGQIVDILCA